MSFSDTPLGTETKDFPTLASRLGAGYWVFVDETSVTKSGHADGSTNTLSSSLPKTIKRHSKFCFDVILVAIQIEDTLFNVHKYQLAKSEIFSDMFKVPKPKGDGPEEGSSLEHPIVLKGVSASDFAALLTVLYASHFSNDHPAPEASLIIPGFRLANMFNFSELRAFLLPFAEEHLDDIDKIVFAREFDIKKWLAPAHLRLCLREAPLNGEEAGKLGIESVLIISRIQPGNSRGSNETSSSPTPKIIKQHPTFFFDNILVAIQIEDTMFNVHRYQLAKSEVFSDMFKASKPEGNGLNEGSSPEHPIVLKGVAASDFAALLTVLYASQFSTEQATPKAALIVPAFRLANMFNFSELRSYLLPLAEQNLGDVDKIVFAREFDIKEWLAPAHIRLCQREELLNSEEARKLGAESVLIILRMREQYRVRPSSSPLTVGDGYCFECAGMTYVRGGFTCDGCRGMPPDPGFLRYNGPGRMAQGTVATTDNNAIEVGVKKWVNDGCTVKE
ncbi:hypothetical protein RSOLAG22IIIB_04887 [Rhizoctonia solani]|uniref:BTB domain-containing protein n=1 Tax=Rhizoctonia solani TaxID=456999 RepID=A0A0K6G0G4_9AGAM|nr:hypothetical protein RSOLAG22IIIB_04887 [Rhizoctonia solani]